MKITSLKGGYKNNVSLVEIADKKLVLIRFEKDSDIIEIHKKIDSLLSKYPSRKLIKCVKNQNTLNCFFSYLEGNTISWDSYTMKHIKLLGIVLSDFHYYLKDAQTNGLSDGIKIQIDNCAEIREYFKDLNIIVALKKKLNIKLNADIDKYIKLLEEIYILPKQILHLDMVRGNVLFLNKESLGKDILNDQIKMNNYYTMDNELYLSGVIDFEKVAIGPTILDVARTLAFLIVDCKYKEEYKVSKYFINGGYIKRGRNKELDLKYLDKLIEYFYLYDFFKFLKYNPYEDLNRNEHFVRTRDKLISLKLLLNIK